MQSILGFVYPCPVLFMNLKSCVTYIFNSLQYNSLTLCKRSPEDKEDQTFILKKHIGDPKSEAYVENHDIELSLDSLICWSGLRENRPFLLNCITMYNEPPVQLVESLIGLYRAYYELVHWKDELKNKMQVVIVIDGYDIIPIENLKMYEKVGIYNSFCTKDYKYVELSSDKQSHEIKFRGMP